MKSYFSSKTLSFKKINMIFILILILSILIGSFIYIDNSLRPTIKNLAQTKALEIANKSINKAISEVVKENLNYSDLIDTKLDSNGKITLMQSNTIMMNKIASDVALKIQDELKNTKTTTSYIPLGTVLNSPLLAKYSPKIKISIEPIGTAYVDFKTDFESSGINQTRHKIYLEAKTQVKVIVPLTTSIKEVKAQIPISETVIIGDVPNSYVNIPKEEVGSELPNIQMKDINK